MISISVKTDAARLMGRLTAIERRQMPFAVASALTRTAKGAAAKTTADLPRIFDRPTPFTRKAIGIKPARKARPAAQVFVKSKQAEYLLRQETGGIRKPKRRAIVTPQAQRVNRYGNIGRGAIRRLLARSDTFSGAINGQAGIWKRRYRRGDKSRQASPRLLVSYVDAARYMPRFNFAGRVEGSARRIWPVAMRRSLRKALATAR